jgi:hypothetical protein
MSLGLAGYSAATFTNSQAATTTLASPSFSPAAGDVLYVIGFIDNASGGSAITESAPTNTGTALTWTLVARDNNYQTTQLQGCLFVYRAFNASAQAGITVSINGGVSGLDKSVAVIGFTGADSAQAGAQTAVAHPSSATAAVAAMTTSQAGSWCWMAGLDWTGLTTVTPAAGQSTQCPAQDPGVGDTEWAQKENPQPASGRASGTSVTMSATLGVTGLSHLVAFEVIPGSGGSPVTSQVAPAQPGQTWRRQFQHPQQAPAAAGLLPLPPSQVNPAGPAQPGQTWKRQFQHPQQVPQMQPVPDLYTATYTSLYGGPETPGIPQYPSPPAQPGQTWRRQFQHPQRPVPPVPSAPQVPGLPQSGAPSRTARQAPGRARLGSRGLAAAGIAVAAILPQPVFQAARTVVPHAAPARARAGAQGRQGTGNPGPFANRLLITTQPRPPVPAGPAPRRARLGPQSRAAGGNAGTANRLPVSAPACLPFLPHPQPARARIGGRGFPAAGNAGLVNRLPVTPPAPRPNLPHSAPQRAIWRGITGPVPSVTVTILAPREPAQPRRGPGARAAAGPQGRLGAGSRGLANQPLGTPQPTLPVVEPGGRPARALWRGNAVRPALIIPPAAAPAWHPQPRRGPGARALWRQTAGPANRPVTAAPAQFTQPRRTPGARAIWRGPAGHGNHGAASPPTWHSQPRRAAPSRAAWRGNAVKPAAVAASPAAAPRQVRQPARLAPSRAVWRGSPVAASQPLGLYQPFIPVVIGAGARSPQPARARTGRAGLPWGGVTVAPVTVTVTALAPPQAIQPRRPASARARTGPQSRPGAGTAGLRNQPLGSPQPTLPLVEPGAKPARAIWRGNAVRPAPAVTPAAVSPGWHPQPRARSPQPARAGRSGALAAGQAGAVNRLPVQGSALPVIKPGTKPARAALGPQGRNAGGITGLVNQPLGRFAPRLLPPWNVRRPLRAIARGIFGPPNQAVTFAAVGPPAWKPQPRRGPGARAVVRGVAGPRNSVVTPAPKQVTQPRRGPGARALWHGVTGQANRPVTAAPRQIAQPRRGPGARAIWRAISGPANRPVTAAPAQLTQPRRLPGARAMWRGLASPFSPGPQPRPRPAPRIQRPAPARAIWRGPARAAMPVAVPAPRQLTQPRRPAGTRALWRRITAPPPFVPGTGTPQPALPLVEPGARPSRAHLGQRSGNAGGNAVRIAAGVIPVGASCVVVTETSYRAADTAGTAVAAGEVTYRAADTAAGLVTTTETSDRAAGSAVATRTAVVSIRVEPPAATQILSRAASRVIVLPDGTTVTTHLRSVVITVPANS